MKYAITLALLLAASTGFAEDKPVHVFILSGQSNMARLDPETGFVPEAKALLESEEVVYIKVAKSDQSSSVSSKGRHFKGGDEGQTFEPRDELEVTECKSSRHSRGSSLWFVSYSGSRRGLEPYGASVKSHAASRIDCMIVAGQPSSSSPKSSNRVWLPRLDFKTARCIQLQRAVSRLAPASCANHET